MENEIDPIGCRKTDCLVATTGSCADGHTPLAACPNFGGQQLEVDDAYDGELDEDLVDVPADSDRVSLPLGDALTVDDVARLLRRHAATFVTVIGDSHSGKTTLICALYDRFLRGTFGSLSFAGSQTLIALERRSHHARVDSGRATPETARTSHLDGLRYFHFALAPNGSPDKRLDLLLSDRSGEVYRNARNDSSLVGSLPEIPQADRVVLLLDGRRVADPIERAGALQSVRQTLRAFLDNDALGPTSIVQVVTTKVDLIAESLDQKELDDTLASFRDRLSSQFGQRLGSLSFYDIAARDPTSRFAAAHGLDTLLADWTTSRALYTRPTSPLPALHSEFDRLLARTRMEAIP